MTDPIEFLHFLRARLDEDGQAARDAQREMPPGVTSLCIHLPPEVITHNDRHLPTRVLRRVEADRRIIELHSAEPGQHPDFCGHDQHELPCPTLRLRALPYDYHPDYRPEWRP